MPLTRRMAYTAILLAVTTGCSLIPMPTPGTRQVTQILPAARPVPLRNQIAVDFGLGKPFATKATKTDVHHVEVRLLAYNGSLDLAQYDPGGAVFVDTAYRWAGGDDLSGDNVYTFNNVPPGEYVVVAKAFDSTNGCISVGDGALSSNYATVQINGTVNYSGANSALKLTIPLIDTATTQLQLETTFEDGAPSAPITGDDGASGTSHVSAPITVGNLPLLSAIDGTGHLWITNLKEGKVSKLAADGSLLQSYQTAGIGWGLFLTLDALGNAWVAFTGSDSEFPSPPTHEVYKLRPNGTIVGPFYIGPYVDQVAVDAAGDVWAPSMGKLTKLDSNGALVATYLLKDASNNDADGRNAVIGPDGKVWVQAREGQVFRFDLDGTQLSMVDIGESLQFHPFFDSTGSAWYICGDDSPHNKVYKIAANGSSYSAVTLPVGQMPRAIAVDASDQLWVATADTLYKYNSAGTLLGSHAYGIGMGYWFSLVIDPQGKVWILNADTGVVTRLDGNGTPLGSYQVGSGPLSIGFAGDHAWVACMDGKLYKITP